MAETTTQKIVEMTRARVDSDRTAVLALPAGELVLEALQQPRPERCEQLDATLAGRRFRHAHRTNSLPFNTCPEMALASQLSPAEFPEIDS